MNVSETIASIKNLNDESTEKFNLLKKVSDAVNSDSNHPSSRELVLRLLDKRHYFNEYVDILDSLAREVGLMPYVDESRLGLKDSVAYEFFKPLNDDGEIVFHRAQAEVYHKLIAGQSVILSAPTSFGKSKLVDSIIELNRYKNIAIIVPTIALIDETRRRLSRFSGLYKLITQVSQEPSNRNIFILTAERLIAFDDLPNIDFFVIDEFYKIGALDRDEERTVALNQAFYKLHKMGGQFYLLGPNIQHIPDNLDRDLKCVFYNTQFSTVVSEVEFIQAEDNEYEALLNLVSRLEGQTLVYCRSPKRVNDVAEQLLALDLNLTDSGLEDASDWIGNHFHENWIFPKTLKEGIALHHGRLPRALSQLSIKLFNENKVKILVCTSTLIEGVNTSAKNIVIFDHKIGTKKYDYFTFNNIKGRGGRMFKHFIGHVYIFNAPPQEELPYVDFPFYSQGDEVPDSLLIQLDETDLKESSKSRLNEYFQQSDIPVELIKQNSNVHPRDQVALSQSLLALSKQEIGLMLWTGMPKYNELEICCKLIWEHFVSNGKAGIFTYKQLTWKLFSLFQQPDIKGRVQDELEPGEYSAKDPNEAVERILDFDRNWASYTFPRLLMVLDSIQRYVLNSYYGKCGDYSVFATNVETLFRKPSLIAFEEFGLPLQIGEKLDSVINFSTDIDLAISQLKGYQVQDDGFTDFEKSLIIDVRNHL